MNSPPEDVQAVLDTLQAMCQQEENGYQTTACLHQSDGPQSSSSRLPLDVNVACHNKMVSWCYGIADYCNFQRETVAVAINYLDRFLTSNTPTGQLALTDRKVFQLASMTCLYTAVKMHEPQVMDPRTVSSLSRGTYSVQDIEAMEQYLLPALRWRLNPPTALAFVRLYLQLLPANLLPQQKQRDAVYDLAKFQTELAVAQYDFLGVKPSIVAYGALVNALESLHRGAGGNDNQEVLQYATDVIAKAVPSMPGQSDAILEVQNWLYMAISSQPASHQTTTTGHQKHQQDGTASCSPSKESHLSTGQVSPRSISAAAQS